MCLVTWKILIFNPEENYTFNLVTRRLHSLFLTTVTQRSRSPLVSRVLEKQALLSTRLRKPCRLRPVRRLPPRVRLYPEVLGKKIICIIKITKNTSTREL